MKKFSKKFIEECITEIDKQIKQAQNMQERCRQEELDLEAKKRDYLREIETRYHSVRLGP